jgi:hypothetical protein
VVTVADGTRLGLARQVGGAETASAAPYGGAPGEYPAVRG